MHLFVSEIGFWIQDPLFSAFLMGKTAYNPVASGQVNAWLPPNPEKNMVRRRRDFNSFQLNSTKNDSDIPVLKE